MGSCDPIASDPNATYLSPILNPSLSAREDAHPPGMPSSNAVRRTGERRGDGLGRLRHVRVGVAARRQVDGRTRVEEEVPDLGWIVLLRPDTRDAQGCQY
jgi:hypothetical protein